MFTVFPTTSNVQDKLGALSEKCRFVKDENRTFNAGCLMSVSISINCILIREHAFDNRNLGFIAHQHHGQIQHVFLEQIVSETRSFVSVVNSNQIKIKLLKLKLSLLKCPPTIPGYLLSVFIPSIYVCAINLLVPPIIPSFPCSTCMMYSDCSH